MFDLKSKKKEDILRLSATIYFAIVIISTVVYSVFFYYTQIFLLTRLELVYLAIHIAWGIRAFKEDYNKVMNVIPYYFLFISIYLFLFVLYLWKLGIYTGVLWYALIPFGAKLHFCNNNMKGWTLFCIFLVIALLVLQYFIEFDFVLENKLIIIFNICNTLFCFAYMYSCFYFIIKLSQKNESQEEFVSQSSLNDSIPIINANNHQLPSDKFLSLFSEITDYFEREMPYLDPDFDASKLAHSVNSNTNYIAKAIGSNTGNNFNWYVNSFRIKYIQKLFEDEEYSSYTIEHLRIKAGFKNQATFNNTFKKQIGVTPSEYLENLKVKWSKTERINPQEKQ